ncbi:twin-arginine translocation signal domain-containing protein [Paramagnetospirillum kuznetsovii]|nr:twin-arginine translocation signal domain-containing protein [Paramagnetospirillum kuznetsovii]
MTERPDKTAAALDRRAFLKVAGLSAGAAGAAAVGVTATKADAKAATEAQTGAGYQETAHVRRAYEAAGF